MHIVQVNYAYAADLTDPDALLERFSTLTGWSEAVLSGHVGQVGRVGQVEQVGKVSVVQRFGRDGVVTRRGIQYLFRRERGGPTPDRWSACCRVARAVATLHPDVVHVNGLGFLVPTWWMRQRLPASVAIVMQDHAGGQPRGGRLRGHVQRRLMAAVDGFLFTSVEQAAPWQRAGCITPRQRLHQVLESSTTFAEMPRDGARGASSVEGDPAILWVGRLNANKDPLTVLDGVERALRELPGGRLTMVYGEGDLEAAVRERVEQSSVLRSRVRLVGRVPAQRMPAFYSAADLFVLGSHHESCGYALLEALACGAVPVVTDVPSFRAVTDDGRIGRLWPPGDAGACARALVEAGQLDLAVEQRRVIAHFAQTLSWPAVGRAAAEIYAAVVKERR
jgi:glycosyltransferase involved in cell wall biosynthesis